MITSGSNQIAIKSIYGTWYLNSSPGGRHQNTTWILTRKTDTPYGWGQRFEFRETGDLIDAYSARCGNDAAIHYWQGNWTWDAETNILLLKVSVDYKTTYTAGEPPSGGYWERPIASGQSTVNCHPSEADLEEQALRITEISSERLILRSLLRANEN